MKKRIIVSFCILWLSWIGFTCQAANAASTTPLSGTGVISPATTTNPDFNPNGFFTFHRDLRLCPSPLCGGFFVKQVNKKQTLCADGIYRNECYVAEIKWATKDAPDVAVIGNGLLKGVLAKKSILNFGSFGVFRATAAYKPATNKSLGSNMLFVGLQNNGIVCITSPCFSFDQFILNSTKNRMISEVDLQQSGASQKLIDAANQRLAEGKVLIAAGFNGQYVDPFGFGIAFVVKEFYLPVKKPVGICPDGYNSVGGQCVTPVIGCVAPQIELEAMGGAAYIDPVTGEVISNITRSCVNSCEPPGILDKPAHCSVFYP